MIHQKKKYKREYANYFYSFLTEAPGLVQLKLASSINRIYIFIRQVQNIRFRVDVTIVK
jgi:hypothetical protein